jgi:hypothetical protein
MVFRIPALTFTGAAILLRVSGQSGLREQSPTSEQRKNTTIRGRVDVGLH